MTTSIKVSLVAVGMVIVGTLIWIGFSRDNSEGNLASNVLSRTPFEIPGPTDSSVPKDCGVFSNKDSANLFADASDKDLPSKQSWACMSKAVQNCTPAFITLTDAGETRARNQILVKDGDTCIISNARPQVEDPTVCKVPISVIDTLFKNASLEDFDDIFYFAVPLLVDAGQYKITETDEVFNMTCMGPTPPPQNRVNISI